MNKNNNYFTYFKWKSAAKCADFTKLEHVKRVLAVSLSGFQFLRSSDLGLNVLLQFCQRQVESINPIEQGTGHGRVEVHDMVAESGEREGQSKTRSQKLMQHLFAFSQPSSPLLEEQNS